MRGCQASVSTNLKREKHFRKKGTVGCVRYPERRGRRGTDKTSPWERWGGGTAALAGRMWPLEKKSRTLPLISSFYLQGELVFLLFLFCLFSSSDQCYCWDYTG